MQEARFACDSCRRRKVRCDSEQPCRRCIEGGVECTYGSARHRVSATTYVRNLERQVAALQQQLQTATNAPANSLPSNPRQGLQAQQPSIDILFDAGDDLVLDQASGTRIYRFSAALNILRTIADMLDVGLISTPSLGPPGVALVEAIDLPLQIPSRDGIDWLDVGLPPRPEFERLVSCAIDQALVCHQCLDPKAFGVRLNDLHDPARFYTVTKNKAFMSLVYAVLALGERYSDESGRSMQMQADSLPSGFQYFRASRCLTHADTVPSGLDHILARILQARYLTSVSHVSEAHSTLCKGISVATHMGLHFEDSSLHAHYPESELDDRRRVFAVLYMMDVYISFILGLPRSLSYAHPKQTLGLRTEDLHDEGREFLARDATSPVAETIMAQKMFRIYAKILDHQSHGDIDAWFASAWVADVQQDFKNWEAVLPTLPEDVSQSRALLGQLTLRIHYTGAKMVLYAPCLHHLGRERFDPNFNIDGFTFGSDCVQAAGQTVLLVEILETQKLLNGATWLNGFVITLAASVLTYFVIYSKTRVTIEESKLAITKAGRMLASLRNNRSSKKVLDSLSPYVDMVLGQDT